MIDLLHGNLPASLNPVKQLRPLTEAEFREKLAFFSSLINSSISAYKRAQSTKGALLLQTAKDHNQDIERAEKIASVLGALYMGRLDNSLSPYALWAYAWALVHTRYYDAGNEAQFRFYARIVLTMYPKGGNNG